MKFSGITALVAAAAVLFLPCFARAQDMHISSEAPGVVMLENKVDAQKLAPGAIIQARLVHSTRLADGTELPAGTRLIASVSQDDMNFEGKMKLALRFTEARRKDGTTLPIHATILAVSTDFAPVQNDPDTIEALMAVPDNLLNQPDQVDEIGVTRNIDMHSNISSANSGVFITTDDDIKLPEGTKMELAIAPASSSI